MNARRPSRRASPIATAQGRSSIGTTFFRRLADVFGQRPIKAVVLKLLEHLRAPACTTANREDRREQIGRNA
jgi:hypothetical protein